MIYIYENLYFYRLLRWVFKNGAAIQYSIQFLYWSIKGPQGARGRLYNKHSLYKINTFTHHVQEGKSWMTERRHTKTFYAWNLHAKISSFKYYFSKNNIFDPKKMVSIIKSLLYQFNWSWLNIMFILVHSDDYDMPSLAIPTTMICHIKSCQNLTNL